MKGVNVSKEEKMEVLLIRMALALWELSVSLAKSRNLPVGGAAVALQHTIESLGEE